MATLTAVVNTDLKISCLVEDGNDLLYPQATITTPDSSVFVVNLSHDSLGRYETTITGDNFSITGVYYCVYIPYTDPAHTITATDYYFSMDQILVSTADISTLAADMARSLGLEHDNSLIDLAQYDPCNQLVAARLRIFDSAINLNSAIVDELVTSTPGLLYSYMAVTTYARAGRMQSYRFIRLT